MNLDVVLNTAAQYFRESNRSVENIVQGVQSVQNVQSMQLQSREGKGYFTMLKFFP